MRKPAFSAKRLIRRSPLLRTGKHSPKQRIQRRTQIGPIRREDNTLAVRNEEKPNLINTFFTTVGTSLSKNTVCPPVETGKEPTLTQTISTISISEDSLFRKIKARKPNKAGGPDGITPKLLLLAEPAVVPSLTKLYSISVNSG